MSAARDWAAFLAGVQPPSDERRSLIPVALVSHVTSLEITTLFFFFFPAMVTIIIIYKRSSLDSPSKKVKSTLIDERSGRYNCHTRRLHYVI